MNVVYNGQVLSYPINFQARHSSKVTNIENITGLKSEMTGGRSVFFLNLTDGARGVKRGSTVKQLQLVVRAGLELGTSGFQVRRPVPLGLSALLALLFSTNLLEKQEISPKSNYRCQIAKLSFEFGRENFLGFCIEL